MARPSAAPPRPPSERAWVRAVLVVTVVAMVTVFAAWWEPRDGATADIDLRNGRAFIQDNLWSTDAEQYAVWVDGSGNPILGIREAAGSWRRTDLAAIEGNPLDAPTDDDSHNVYVVAVDSMGNVHVAGNMQSDPLRYIRTREPGSLDSWIEPPIGGANESVTYPAFVGLPDGTLLFLRREGRRGVGGILADRLAPGADDWEHLGTLIDGRPSGEGPYLQHASVDPADGSLHLGWLWRKGVGTVGNNDVSYMRSDDGGTTWRTSGGTALALPVTHESAEVVFDTPDRGSGLLNHGGMVIDGEGRPHIVYSGRDQLLHLWFDGQQWHDAEPIPAFKGSRAAAARAPDGSVWAVAARGARLVAVQIHPEVGSEVDSATVSRRWEPTYDSQAMQRDDRLEVLLVPSSGDEPTVESLALGSAES